MGMRYDEDGFLDAYCKAWHRGGERLSSFFTADARYFDVAFDVELGCSAQELLDLCIKWGTFTPDTKMTFWGMVADGKTLYFEWRWAGTATGPLNIDGIDHVGTGGAFEILGVSMCSIGEDGMLTAHKDYFDPRPILDVCKATVDA